MDLSFDIKSFNFKTWDWGASSIPNDWFLIETGDVCEEDQYNYFNELFEECSKRKFAYGIGQ